jgi:hypothetical protein
VGSAGGDDAGGAHDSGGEGGPDDSGGAHGSGGEGGADDSGGDGGGVDSGGGDGSGCSGGGGYDIERAPHMRRVTAERAPAHATGRGQPRQSRRVANSVTVE